MMSQHDIPEELIVQILPLLPVKSLLRFRSLSKDIGALIDSPNFINSHVSKSFKLIFSDKSEKNKLHVCDVNNLDMEKNILHLRKLYTSVQVQFEFYGCCKGLILLKRGRDELSGLTLWNPSTNKYKDLPYFPFGEVFQINGSGLVYDNYTNDYKAFISVSYSRNLRFHYKDEFWVYELKSNIWRKVQNNYVPGIGCFTDGSLHWLSYSQQQIVSFDIRKETFCLSSQPVCSISSMSGFSSELHDFDGCLCISYFSIYRQFQLAFYMRKKDGVVDDQFTWIQLYSPPSYFTDMFSSGNIKVIGYPKRGSDDDKEKIMLHLSNYEDYIVSYDLEKKTFGKFEIENKNPTWIAPFFCIESFVQIASNSDRGS